jgi:hypothetical protein
MVGSARMRVHVQCDVCFRSSPPLSRSVRDGVELTVHEQLQALGWALRGDRRLCPICGGRAKTLPPSSERDKDDP